MNQLLMYLWGVPLPGELVVIKNGHHVFGKVLAWEENFRIVIQTSTGIEAVNLFGKRLGTPSNRWKIQRALYQYGVFLLGGVFLGIPLKAVTLYGIIFLVSYILLKYMIPPKISSWVKFKVLGGYIIGKVVTIQRSSGQFPFWTAGVLIGRSNVIGEWKRGDINTFPGKYIQ